MNKPTFIYKINSPADILTLANACIISVVCLNGFTGHIRNPATIAVFIWLSVFLDAMDGILARYYEKKKGKKLTDFGRYFDSFIDILIYFIAPGIVLFQLGFNGYWIYSWLACFIIGMIRLSVFNELGNSKSKDGKLAYTGMPVFWGAMFMTYFLVLRNFQPIAIVRIELLFVLIYFGINMLRNKPFRKFNSLVEIVSIILVHLALILWKGGLL